MESILPRDLVEQILVNLPVKYLLKFKSVCKSWNSLINDPKFIHNHLQVNINKSKRAYDKSTIVLGWAGWSCDAVSNDDYDGSEHVMISLANIGGDDDDEISFSSNEIIDHIIDPDSIDYDSNSDGYGLTRRNNMHGSYCNGVLCVVNYSPYHNQHKVVFYNPVLREHRSVSLRSFGSHGFGYDPRTHDYKFVRMLCPSKFVGPFIVQVYTLRTDCWREVKPPDMCSTSLKNGVYLKGRYYWINLCAMNLLSFDMSEESFGCVALPIDKKSKHPRGTRVSLMEQSESIVFIVHIREMYRPWSNHIDLWATKTMDGCDWTKQRTIRLEPTIRLPISFVKEDKVLIEDTVHAVKLFNISTRNITKLPKHDHMTPSSTFVASSYVESLVSVKLSDNAAQETRPSSDSCGVLKMKHHS